MVLQIRLVVSVMQIILAMVLLISTALPNLTRANALVKFISQHR
jgi:hypothetical protein